MAIRFDSASRTDIGRVRQRNEDRCLMRPDLGLWAVADGMGGHDHGDRASSLIVSRLDEIADPANLAQTVVQQLSDVHCQLEEEAGPFMTIGSTVVVLIACEQRFSSHWVGDSRIYRLRDGNFTQLTRDHTWNQELVDQGKLTPEEARNNPFGSSMTRAVGAADEFAVDRVTGSVLDGDRYLLCSDGLTGELDDAQIADILSENAIETAADKLLQCVLSGPARDNVTFVIVDAKLISERPQRPA